MTTLHKINFTENEYKNIFVYSEKAPESEKNIPIFNLPQTNNFLTIYILIDNLNDEKQAQLVNCLTSINIQTYLNIKTKIINFDKSLSAEKKLLNIADGANAEYISPKSDIASAIDNEIKSNNSKYCAIINYFDIIPRIRDIEFIVTTLFEKDYDFLTLTVNYFDKNGNDFNMPISEPRILKSTENFHYSAYFKTEILKKFKYKNLKSIPLDEKMVETFEKNNLKGNHIISKTQMNLLSKIKIR